MRVVSTKPYGSRPRDDARVVALMTAIAAFGAGLVHVAAAADHDQVVMAIGFEVVAVLQVGLGGLIVMRRASAPVLAAGMALMLASIALWAISRTVGLGFIGGEHVEPIGFRDSVTVLFELVACVGLWELLAGAKRPAAPPGFPGSPVAALGAVAIALGAPAMVTGGHSHTEGHGAGVVHAGGPAGHGDGGGPGHPRGEAHTRGEHRGSSHGDHATAGPGGRSGHSGHAANGHAGHSAETGLPVAHTHGTVPVADHAAHTTAAAPGAPHAGSDHGTATGGSHDSGAGHPAPPAGGGHDPGHAPPTAPAPTPGPEPPPDQSITQFVTDEIDKLVPG